MNLLLNQASQLNSYGVSLLASGDRPSAIAAFRSALKKLSSCSHFQQQTSEAFTSTASECQNPTLSILCIPPQSSLGAKETTGDAGQLFLYTHAFLFDAFASTALSSFEARICFFSSLVLFNLALAFHLKDNGMNTRAQRKALSMYNAGTNIVQELMKETLDQHTMNGLNSLLMAFLNNKAHIYFELSDFAMLQEQLSHLRDTLTPHYAIVYNDQQMQGFLLNAMLMNTTFAARAA